MKRVVGISLGSSKRDHSVELELLNTRCRVERIGTDGDLSKMISFIKENDGHVDAFGLGGMDRYIYAVNRRYELRDAQKIARAARKTPIVDGSGLKNTLERMAIKQVAEQTGLFINNPRVLLMSAMDRLGMAESLDEEGCELIYGDCLFALGVPVPLRNLKSLAVLARILVPVIRLLPFSMLYPTGSKQDVNKPKYPGYFRRADIIAGDFHFIKRYMPAELPGKTIITNTVTTDDLNFLRKRGVEKLITTTPELEGRSFGTNIMEAILICLSGSDRELTAEKYHEMLKVLDIRPRIVDLTQE